MMQVKKKILHSILELAEDQITEMFVLLIK